MELKGERLGGPGGSKARKCDREPARATSQRLPYSSKQQDSDKHKEQKHDRAAEQQHEKSQDQNQ